MSGLSTEQSRCLLALGQAKQKLMQDTARTSDSSPIAASKIPMTDAAPPANAEPSQETIPLQQPQGGQHRRNAKTTAAAPYPRPEAAGKLHMLPDDINTENIVNTHGQLL